MATSQESRIHVDHDIQRRADPGWTSYAQPARPRLTLGFSSLSERRLVLDWLSEGLRPGQPARLIREYPLIFDRNASAFHFTVWDGHQPAAFCTLWAVQFRVGVQRLRVGMISLVYTDPLQRGRGHARRILQAAIARAEALELGFVMLWSDLDGLYQPLGFRRAGQESLLILEPTVIDSALAEFPRVESLEVSPPEVADWPAIERLRGFRACQLELDPGDLARARTTPDLHVRVARNSDGLRGFAMCGRGDDFASVIHEWGGDPSASLACCRALMSEIEPDREMMMMIPPNREDAPWALRRNGARVVNQPLAWLRIASPGALSSDLSSFLGEGSTLDLQIAGSDEERQVVVKTRHSERTLNESDFLESIFGSSTGQPTPSLGELQAADDTHPLPLPFFVWGLESI